MLALSVARCTFCNRVHLLKVLKSVLKKYFQSFVCSSKHPSFTHLCIKESKMQLLCYVDWQIICFRMGNMWNNLMFLPNFKFVTHYTKRYHSFFSAYVTDTTYCHVLSPSFLSRSHFFSCKRVSMTTSWTKKIGCEHLKVSMPINPILTGITYHQGLLMEKLLQRSGTIKN